VRWSGAAPEGIHWIRQLFRALAAEGRTVFVSSHLMNEMALTADHLIIIGRGRLIADTRMEEFVESRGRRDVLVRSPRSADLAALLTAHGATVAADPAGGLGAGMDHVLVRPLHLPGAVHRGVPGRRRDPGDQGPGRTSCA
jgi:ABC-2 type transport system ATP-binding protein